MATLKSIKNKYLQNSDGDVLGVTTNTENISALSFKLATADSLSKFNLVDGFTDDYNDATGVDASASTDDERDSTDNFYSATVTVNNFTAKGGGEGGHRAAAGSGLEDGFAGGSGGGGGTTSGDGHITTGGTSNKNTYSGWTSYGNSGGVGQHVGGSHEGGGGGGGMSASGSNSSGGTGGSGGAGQSFTTQDGSPLTYGGGGGAGGNSGGGGGSGGGGAEGVAGGTNTGGGGGGGPSAKPGGSGIAWFRFTPSGGSITSNGVTATGTWTVPPNVSSTEVLLVAGGGGGGKGGSGGGGGGGQGLWHPAYPVTAGDVWSVTIGDGGAAGVNDSTRGSNGGDTIFAISKYASAMTLQSNAFTAQTAPTTARIVLDEWAYKGSQTLNTDIKAYASRDNGTTFTQITLADQGFLLGNGGIDGNTQTMLHMDGSDNGTTFTDSCTEGGNTAKVWTASGNAHTSTDQFKFGTASAQFDGTGDWINTPATSDWDFGSDDFTIDFWMRPGVVDSQQRIFGNLNSGGSSSQFEFILGGSNNMSFSGSAPSGLAVTNGATLAVNTWYHIAATRNGNDWRLFVNGTAGSTASFSGAMNANTTTSIGRSGEYNAQLYTGFIDEVRITTGVALWTSNFSVPVGPYQTSRRLLSGSVDISGQPSGTNMKYKITTHNQAATKQTRVYGTSMAWA